MIIDTAAKQAPKYAAVFVCSGNDDTDTVSGHNFSEAIHNP